MLLNHFAGLDLSDANLHDGQVDVGKVLGDAYEYLVYQFADDAGKKGGEFYTPREVAASSWSCWSRRNGCAFATQPQGPAGC